MKARKEGVIVLEKEARNDGDAAKFSSEKVTREGKKVFIPSF